MKCVKTEKGSVERLPNEVAEQLVKSGDATYVAKSEWKAGNPEPRKKVNPGSGAKA